MQCLSNVCKNYSRCQYLDFFGADKPRHKSKKVPPIYGVGFWPSPALRETVPLNGWHPLVRMALNIWIFICACPILFPQHLSFGNHWLWALTITDQCYFGSWREDRGINSLFRRLLFAFAWAVTLPELLCTVTKR